MRIFNFLLFTSRNCLCNGSYSKIQNNFCCSSLLGTSLKLLNSNLFRSFTIYHSLYKTKLEIHNKKGVKSEDKSKEKRAHEEMISGKVSVINEKNREIVMEFLEAQKYAKRKQMHLVPVEGTKRLKYKLVDDVFGIKKKKTNDSKTLICRDGIGVHDLEVKIKQVSKFLNKGLTVTFVVESSIAEKTKEVLSTLEKSNIHEFFVSKTKKARGIHLVYHGKVRKMEDDKKSEDSIENSSE